MITRLGLGVLAAWAATGLLWGVLLELRARRSRRHLRQYLARPLR